MDLGLEEGDRKKALNRLRKTPRQSIDAALHDSLADLEAISQNINLVPQSLTYATLEMFCHHLKETSGKYLFRPAILLGHQSLIGISEMEPLFSQDTPTSLSDSLSRNWTKIACWLDRSFDMLDSSKEEKEKRREFIGAISRILYGVSMMEAELAKRMLGDLHAIRAIARCGVHELESRPKQPAKYIPSVFRFALLSNSSMRNAVLDALVSRAGGTDEDLMRIVVKHMHASQTAEAHSLAVASAVQVAFSIISTETSWNLAFVRKGGICELSRATLVLLAGDRFLDSDLTRLTVSEYFVFSAKVIRLANSSPWIAQLLQRGILMIIVSCISSLETCLQVVVECVQLTLRMLIPSFVHYRVVGEAYDAFRRIPLIGLQHDVDGSSIRAEWEALERLVLERWIVRQKFEIAERISAMEKQRSCATCDAMDDKHVFKRCAGCNTALYCSRECQRSAWKDKGHREECRRMANCLDLTSLRTTKDERFLEHIAKHDIARHLPGIRALALQKFPGRSIHQLLLTIDYAMYPVVIDLIHRKSQKLIGIDKHSDIIVELKYLQGDNTETYIFATELPSLDGVELPINQATSSKSSMYVGRILMEERRPACKDAEGNRLQTTPDVVDEITSRLERRWAASDHWFARCPDRIDETITELLSPADQPELD